jgi:[protein-PII] uridylyltransferase
MVGEPLPAADPIEPEHLARAADGGVHVEISRGESAHTHDVTMIAPDRPGLLSKAAGVLALNSLRVHSASENSSAGSAINTFVVSPHFGSPPAAELLRQQLLLALNGELDVIASLEKRDREASQSGAGLARAGESLPAVPGHAPAAPPRILWHEVNTPGQLLVEVRTNDRPGLLAVLTSVFERAGADISWAKIVTLGSSVRDVFSVSVPAQTTSSDARDLLERELRAVLPVVVITKPAEQAG